MPQDPERRRASRNRLEKIVREEGQTLIGWRTVPTDDGKLGDTAKSVQPFVRQVFIGQQGRFGDELGFERKLYVIRKRAEQEIRYSGDEGGESFYCASLSSRTIVYKGMLIPEQVDSYYMELQDPAVETALALVHSRFSTNTFPSWERAHPYRFVIHNGEINTLRGNVNWMHARQAMAETELFGDDMAK